MAKSTKTNRLSVLYRSIDQTQLSEQAKTVLNKLRLATANFRSKDEESNKAFEAFYNKLLDKKPLAIRTSKEYKDHVRAKKAEIAKKAREARKSKEESRQGQGSEKDANRPAKPYGWRLRGKHNYRKPTREQIRNGEAYYEGRVNRADVKRKKFPMLKSGGQIEQEWVVYVDNEQRIIGTFKSRLSAKKAMNKLWDEGKYDVIGMGLKSEAYSTEYFARGGYMAKGGEITYAVVDENTDRTIVKSKDKNFIKLKYNELKEVYPKNKLSIVEFKSGQYAKGAYMEHGGDVDRGGMIYALREFVSSGEIANKTDVLNYDDIAKIRRIAIQYYMDNGDVPYSFGELNRIMDYANDKFKSGYMAKGGEINVVLNEGNGKTINKLFNDWNNIKTEKQYEKWSNDVKNSKFGTYGTISFNEVLENFEFDNSSAINSVQKNDFKKEVNNVLRGTNKFAQGGEMGDTGNFNIFIPHKVANDLLKMSYSALIELGNKDFSEIVKSDSLQNQLAEKFQKEGIDSMFTSLKRSQRSEVSDMLLKMDDELLNNYFALRGYLGEARYDLYVSEFKKYGTFLDPKNIERVQLMAKGGEMDKDEGVDLFEDYDDQPAEVSAILEKYDLDDANYETLKELNDELKSVGYTFEYGLDGYAYDLRKIGQKGKSEFYKKGGEVFYKESHKLGM